MYITFAKTILRAKASKGRVVPSPIPNQFSLSLSINI